MLIRPATDDDLEAVASLRVQFLAEHRGVDPAAFPAEFSVTTLAFLQRHAAAGTSRSWLACDGETAVGVVTMLLLDLAPRPEDTSGLEGYLINMFVSPAHRRRGLGRQLLAECHRAAADLGLRRLLLHATDDGRPLYERAGFTENPRWMELVL